MRPPTGGRGSWRILHTAYGTFYFNTLSYLFIYICFVFIFNTLSCLCFRAGSSPTSPASTASVTILHTWTPCPRPPDTLSRGGTMRWDHTVCTWTARCTTTSPGGRSSTTLRLSPLTALLYIQAGWHAGPASWSGISLSGSCVSSDSCSGYPGHYHMGGLATSCGTAGVPSHSG